MDPELVREAVESAAGVERRTDGWDCPQTAPRESVRRFRLRLKAFLEELPGDATIQELREAMEPAAAYEEEPA